MASELPDPFLPADIDVRGMPGFIIDVDRLLASELVAIGKPEEKWAALMLWLRAFQQTPSGSLPDDERALAGFSGDPRSWKKLRSVAMRGWTKCKDGRLYHRVLAEQIKIAAASRSRHKATSTDPKTERQNRWRKNLSEMSQRLRELGVKPPTGASLETLRRLLVDAEKASHETSTRLHETSRETGIKVEVPLRGKNPSQGQETYQSGGVVTFPVQAHTRGVAGTDEPLTDDRGAQR